MIKKMLCGCVLSIAAMGGMRLLGGEFYGYYTRVPSGEPSEKFSRTGEDADLIVKFGAPAGQLVFWRGTSYLPYWETAQGKWPLDEIVWPC